MKLAVRRLDIRLAPDFKKVIPRFFNTGDDRSKKLIEKVLHIPEQEAEHLVTQVMDEFSQRYRNIRQIWMKHFDMINYLMTSKELTDLSDSKKMLIGSYFTMEYSIEAAALFNPSVVEDPDQSGAGEGEKKVIVSFRATGEGHISSIIFRHGLLDRNAMIHIEPAGLFVTEGHAVQQKIENKETLEELFSRMKLPEDIHPGILNRLKDFFSYKKIEALLKNALEKAESIAEEKNKMKSDLLLLGNSGYILHFPADSLLSERVIFPVTFTEKNGIEDARFVKFTNDDGTVSYMATYTAYDGSFILPHLIETNDFLQFRISPLLGKAAINKNLALFPRKINGQYAMLSRIDGINNYIMFSDDLYFWETAIPWQQPRYPWEFVQVGNGGSPIETDKGWLVITHGVGPMRKYCLGASLFDREDPRIELGRLKEPMLVPNEDERNGYVPNVVYSCGSLIHQGQLFIPYAVSDYASSFATIPLEELLDEILTGQ
jgi:predicted GH43/DUF377 family glycosyl hydrolase